MSVASGSRIARITRTVADLDRSEAFYRDGLGFRTESRALGDAALAGLLGLPGAVITEFVMRLGDQEIALARFDPPGALYPPDSRSNDLWFQHLAIVVSDMEAAYRMLMRRAPGVISIDGPVTLPPANGSVTAFKFRDPDGHPLELIHFPPGQGREVWRRRAGGPCLGIDHSAVATAATPCSVRFYRRIGFTVADRSRNIGRPQSQLDAVPNARVDVVGLRPTGGGDGPGLELLGYRPLGRPAPPTSPNDRVTDWVTVGVPRLQSASSLASGVRAAVRRDPDGYLMLLEHSGAGQNDRPG